MQAKSSHLRHDSSLVSTFGSVRRLPPGRSWILSDDRGLRYRAGRDCRGDDAGGVCCAICSVRGADRAATLHLRGSDRGGFTSVGSVAGLDLVERTQPDEACLLLYTPGWAWRVDAAPTLCRLVDATRR